MSQPPADNRPPISPQLAVRVAILGGVALTLFAIVFFRLWFLQVLSGDQYLAQANQNRVRDIVIQAPRGDIVDRNGVTLVDNRVSYAIVVEPPRLPPAGARRRALYRRLAGVLGMKPAAIAAAVRQQQRQLPYANATIRSDVPRSVYDYILERQQLFEGVTVQQVFLRQYPFHDLAAQIFGQVGQINAQEVGTREFAGVKPSTVVGQGGLERTYNRYLEGRDGAARVQVDALGEPHGYLARRPPVQGKTLKLSIDLNLEREGQAALAKANGLAHANGNTGGPGAFVALDPRNGQVLAMGSQPSFDPNIFARPVSAKVYARLNNAASQYPLVNRAIAGQYPTGSTFKAITATAALQSHTITPDTPINDPGSVKIGNITFHNAGGAVNGTLALRDAIKVSSDVFFYTLGARTNTDRPLGGALQRWARGYGFGRPTGIDLPDELGGLLPTPRRRDRGYARYLKCATQTCRDGLAAFDRPWTIGDNVNLAVGQGDLEATPLQLATAYSAIANGGKVVRPHIGLEVQDRVGDVLQTIDPGPKRRLALDPANRQAILDGLHAAASQPGGTSADVFKGFPKPVYGKTGTAQKTNASDQSWYVCYVPDPKRPIVVAVTVEGGGFGAQAAAPAARLILSQWFGLRKQLVEGSSRTL